MWGDLHMVGLGPTFSMGTGACVYAGNRTDSPAPLVCGYCHGSYPGAETHAVVRAQLELAQRKLHSTKQTLADSNPPAAI
jgi:hypothetical protein